MTTDITELAQRVEHIISDMKLKHGGNDTYAPVMKCDEFLALVEALEKAQQNETQASEMAVQLSKRLTAAGKRIAELESRTVTVKLPHQTDFDDPLSAYEAIEKCKEAMTAAGIKWEAE